MNYDNPESVLKIYTRAIQERIFKTPVGMIYLKQLQQYLLEQESINGEDVLPITLFVNFDGELREQSNPTRARVQPSKKKEKKSMALPVSIILNVGLIVLVISMFAITLDSSQPNILNYEKNLINQYAAWEQELTEREQAIRERELELKIGE